MIRDMVQWQALARPQPTARQFDVALGVHIEEFVEMLEGMTCNSPSWYLVRDTLRTISSKLKAGELQAKITDPLAVLDGLCDQMVTATGVAWCAGYNFEGALLEVNQSNWSKYVDGKPQFDENGKISKGPNYKKPELVDFLCREHP